MEFKKATIDDFPIAFEFIEQLWSYNTYNKEEVFTVYKEVINNPNSFAFFLIDNNAYKGFCHGDYFTTFWMTGLTCYISSLITRKEERQKGYGHAMLDKAKEMAIAKNCKAIILDSGLPRENAHKFYENYGFEKSCYGFELALHK